MFVCSECGQEYDRGGYCALDGRPLAESDDALLGTQIGSYRLARVIGEGGMGRVYLAVQPVIGSRVAIKVLSDPCARTPELLERFFAEARSVNLIRHECIVSVVDLAKLPDGRPYIVMEYIEGQTLAALVRGGQAPLGGVALVMCEVLSALSAAHAIGIIHRDLKPDNILVTGEGHAKVLDFGIAKLAPGLSHPLSPRTRTGALLGTPAYMAPEQISSTGAIDPRTDVYAAGIVLYEAVTGRLPFRGETLFDLMRQHLEDPPPPPASLRPGLPPALSLVIETALQKSPSRRFPSAAEMADAIEQASSELPPEEWRALSSRGSIPGGRASATKLRFPLTPRPTRGARGAGAGAGKRGADEWVGATLDMTDPGRAPTSDAGAAGRGDQSGSATVPGRGDRAGGAGDPRRGGHAGGLGSAGQPERVAQRIGSDDWGGGTTIGTGERSRPGGGHDAGRGGGRQSSRGGRALLVVVGIVGSAALATTITLLATRRDEPAPASDPATTTTTATVAPGSSASVGGSAVEPIATAQVIVPGGGSSAGNTPGGGGASAGNALPGGGGRGGSSAGNVPGGGGSSAAITPVAVAGTAGRSPGTVARSPGTVDLGGGSGSARSPGIVTTSPGTVEIGGGARWEPNSRGGMTLIIPGHGPPKPGDPKHFTRPIDYDPKRFDGTAYAPKALALAQGVFPDAQLARFDIEGVHPDGRADLTLPEQSDSSYVFRSPSNSARPSHLPSNVKAQIACYVEVTVGVKQIEVRVRDMDPIDPNCRWPLRPLPRCTLAQVWKRASRDGARSDTVAKVAFLSDGLWFFDNEFDGQGLTKSYSDVCP